MSATYAVEFKKEIIKKYVLSKRDGSFTNVKNHKIDPLAINSPILQFLPIL